jgi:hypothetical protein
MFSLTLMSKGEKRCGHATVGGLSRTDQPFRVSIIGVRDMRNREAPLLLGP